MGLMAMRENMIASNASNNPHNDVNVGSGPGPSLRLKYEVCREMPTQTNQHDCSVYVAAVAERIAACQPSAESGSENTADLSSMVDWLQRDLTPALVVSKRSDMLRVAQE